MSDKRLRYLNNRRRPRAAAAAPKKLRVKITSTVALSFEELTGAIQKAFARLEVRDVARIHNCSLYLTPQTASGAPMILKDDKGKELEILEIHVSAAPARFSKATAGA